MIDPHQPSGILWDQALGFLVIITLSWLDELVSLPTVRFGGAASSNWREAALETGVALAVGLPLFLVTRRLLRRLYPVEGYLRVRACCRRLGDGNEWLPIEESFEQGFNQKPTHGICLDCAKAQLDASFRDA